MIEETAIVTRIIDGQVWIKSLRSGACGGCSQQTSCATATLSKWLPKREFCVECDLALTIGDQVRVAIDDSQLLASSVLLYLLPLLITFVGVGVANTYLPATITDAWLPEIALSLLLLTFWGIHRLQNLFLLFWCFRPQILGKQFMR